MLIASEKGQGPHSSMLADQLIFDPLKFNPSKETEQPERLRQEINSDEISCECTATSDDTAHFPEGQNLLNGRNRRAYRDTSLSEIGSFKPSTLPDGQYLRCGIGNAAGKTLEFSQKSLNRCKLAAEAMTELLQSKLAGDWVNAGSLSVGNLAFEYGFYCTLSPFSWAEIALSMYGLELSPDLIKSFNSDHDSDWRTYLTKRNITLYRGGAFQIVRLEFLQIILYSGLQLTAWNLAFPSPIEALLWKIACIVPLGFLLAAVLFALSTYLVEYAFCDSGGHDLAGRSDSWHQCLQYLSVCLACSLFGLMMACLILVWPSRIYQIVEPFISLRHLPIGVYAAIPWTQIIPHV